MRIIDSFTQEEIDNEEWRPIDGYTGYQVSNLGRVKNKHDKIMMAPTNKIGYRIIGLVRDDGKMVSNSLHRIVALAFLDNPDNLPEVGHQDDDKTNCRASNLYWTDREENMNHNGRARVDRIKSTMKRNGTGFFGHPQRPVVCLDTGVLFESQRDAARQLGLRSELICFCCKGRQHTTGGLHFAYADVVLSEEQMAMISTGAFKTAADAILALNE